MEVRIAVCDSDIEFCKDLGNMIAAHRPEARVELFSSAADLLQAGRDFHIYFLDIKGVSGLDMARKIREHQAQNGKVRSIIIFVTGYREHMEEAFDVQAFHYLLKPVQRDKFVQVLGWALQEVEFRAKQEEEYVLLKITSHQTGSKDTRKVFLRDIYYIESNNKKVTVHTTGGTYEVQGTMDEFASGLGPAFYRCHRCYLVNFAMVSSYNQNEIIIANGDCILLAYRKYSAFVKAYLAYAKGGGMVNV